MTTPKQMTRAQARKATDAAIRLRAASDQRWLERAAELRRGKAWRALGYPTAAAFARSELGINSRTYDTAIRAGKVRLALRAEGVALPNDSSIGAARWASVTSRHAPAIAAYVNAGDSLSDALFKAAYAGTDYLMPPPTDPAPDLGELHPAIRALLLSIEALAFSTPIGRLLEGEQALVDGLEALTTVIEALDVVELNNTNTKEEGQK